MVDWYKDLRRAFALALPGEMGEQGNLPDAFYRALVEGLDELGDQREVDFVHAVEYEDKTGFIIVRDTDAWLVRFLAPRATDVFFLCDLQGGRYLERITADEEGGAEVEAVYEHQRLGQDTPLRARIPRPLIKPGTFTTDDTDYALDRGDQLRRTLRRWAKVARRRSAPSN
jgi:hypothetical protein